MSNRVTFTFIRHGESTDNLRSVWAGWADATLTNHGMNQARAVGDALTETQFAAIHPSPLKRAYLTAQAILKKQRGSLVLETSPLLREHHFGEAEGKPWTNKRDDVPLPVLFEKGIYPSSLSRKESFPDGESLDDVQARANDALADIIMPYVRESAREGKSGVHVAIVSHGIFIKEMLRALAKHDETADMTACDFQWLRNTGWARVVVEMGVNQISADAACPLQVSLTHFNECEHLVSVKRQRGGIGREAYDPGQKDIRGFFGGGPRALEWWKRNEVPTMSGEIHRHGKQIETGTKAWR
ncbi:histidine phosphatase superfamily [Mycena rebaudengoi]|nr:histidine phosphatase superfamily [Mycena rebaudengoi]